MSDMDCATQAPDALTLSTAAADSVVSSPKKPESRPLSDENTAPNLGAAVIDASTDVADVSLQEAQPAGVWQPPVILEHPEGDAIRRQVEYYFSDENLPHDAHMLLKTGGAENLPVPVKSILGFARMRKYKPKTAVVESLKKSTFLDVIDGKFLKRKIPLSIEPVVKAQTEEEARKEKVEKKGLSFVQEQAMDKPWLTKGMLKATGFEEFYTDPPITPAVFAAEQELYDRGVSFTSRIETAVYRYATKRKFHQKTKFIFDAFMKYGGIDTAPKQFNGGLSVDELAEKDASEIAAMMAIHKVSEDVLFQEDRWEVDFEAVAKGFLSSRVVMSAHYADQKDVMATTGILRNFYNYILHHDVCPEYTDQINAARRVCSLADRELLDTIHVSHELPGDFNSAVSRLQGGHYAAVFSEGETWDGAENLGGPVQDSKDVFMAAILAYGDEDQYAKATSSLEFGVVYEEDVIFEVTGCELGTADAEIRELYEETRKSKPFLKTVGKLFCRRWSYPLARRNRKLHVKEGYESHRPEQDFALFMEDELLQHVFVGMKIEGIVMGLDVGILWLDKVDAVSPSFFEMLPNEFKDEQKAAKKEAAGIYDGIYDGDNEDGEQDDNQDDEQPGEHEQE